MELKLIGYLTSYLCFSVCLFSLAITQSTFLFRMITDQHFEDLAKKGYTVVSDVVSPEECDAAIRQYQEWLSQFKHGTWPKNFSGILDECNPGHLAPTWEMRLKTKKVFAQLWKTEKLLTSFDAIAIGRPPEDGVEDFHIPGVHWLHTDQIASRVGLHAYQGALYLEEQCEDDWTFQVMEASHEVFDSFYEQQPKAAEKAESVGYYNLLPDDIEFYKRSGCSRILRVPVPKGGMALWDSRLIHANARPKKNRKNPGRWRYTIFVSMTPAVWASEEDIMKHKEAYERAMMTTHWSSAGLKPWTCGGRKGIEFPVEIPEVARTNEAKRLSGVIPYDFDDSLPNGDDYIPEWK